MGDQELAQRIHSLPAFQQEGQFSKQAYQTVLQQQRLSPAQFEVQLRQSMIVDQLRTGVTETSLVGRAKLESMLALREQARAITWLRVPWEPLAEDVTVEEQELRDYYESNPGEFMRPERVKLRYVELTREAVAQTIEVTDRALRELYQAERERFKRPERRKARHILIALPEDAGSENVTAAREKVRALRAKLEEGASFAALAKQHSEDQASAAQGGALGWVQPGDMAPVFEDKLYALRVGEVSEPVRTSFGLHLIEVTEIEPATVPPFDAIRDEVERLYGKQEAERRFYDKYEQLANLSYEHPKSLEPAAEAVGLEIQSTDWVTRQGRSGVLGNPDVLSAAFSEEVLRQGNNSEPIEISTDHLVVIQVAEHQEAARRPFEEVRDEIQALLRRKRAEARADEIAGRIVEALRAGQNAESVAKAHEAALHETGYVQRDVSEPPTPVVEAAFRLPKPSADDRSLTRLELDSGDQAVVMVHGVREGDVAELEPSERQTLRSSLRQIYGQAEFQALVRGLRRQADVVVHEDNL